MEWRNLDDRPLQCGAMQASNHRSVGQTSQQPAFKHKETKQKANHQNHQVISTHQPYPKSGRKRRQHGGHL